MLDMSQLTYRVSDGREERPMRQLRGFLPWIAYPIAAAAVDWKMAALVAFAVAVAGIAWSSRTETGRDPFTIAAASFFGGLALVAFVDPTSTVHRYVAALTPATLAIAAAASIGVRRPFTVPFAKRVAPIEFWDTPMFEHINIVLTAVWATSFAAMAVVIAAVIAIHPAAGGIIIAAQIAGFLIPLRICRTYPASVRDRYAAA
jgi:hypothetical protein